MKIQRFVAPDLPQALAAVRRQLGRDAVIVDTRVVRQAGWRRFLRRFDQVEVRAALDQALPARPTRPGATPAPQAAKPAGLDLTERADPALLRRAVFAVDEAAAAPPPAPVLLRAGERRIVALVGPTGAGKTTSTAKLAAHLHLQQGWRVGVVTADTFRVAGADQLGAYARILGVPIEVAPTPAALGRALARMSDLDCVLVDTSGRGHRDDRRMQELTALVRVLREAAGAPGNALEVHLVLAATTRLGEVRAVLAAYRPWVERLLLTKLDECEEPPDVPAAAAAAGLALSYASAGQRVPEDLFVAWPDQILRALPQPAGRAV